MPTSVQTAEDSLGDPDHDHRLRRQRKSLFLPGSDSPYDIPQCLEDKAQYRELLKLRGTLAQKMLDSLQTRLDNTAPTSPIWRQVIVAIQRLSERANLFPAFYGCRNVRVLDKEAVSRGTYGEVYRGERNGEPVCLKKIKVYQTSDRQKIMKFYAKEAVLWGQLSHGNIVPFYGICERDSSPCLVSPWAENGNVVEYIVKNPNADRLALIADITAGLEYLHDLDVIHGDLKGANVLVNLSGAACLADFGLSSIYDSKILDWSSQSAAASIGGTVRWQAPELVSESGPMKNTKSTDIYSWACTCYEIFSGEIPYACITYTPTVYVKKIKGVLPAELSSLKPEWEELGITDNFLDLLLQCWKQISTDRPSIETVQSQIEGAGRTCDSLANSWVYVPGPANSQSRPQPVQ